MRYFHDDDDLSLSDLVKNEKMGTAENQNKLFMRMASKVRSSPGISFSLRSWLLHLAMVYFSDRAVLSDLDLVY